MLPKKTTRIYQSGIIIYDNNVFPSTAARSTDKCFKAVFIVHLVINSVGRIV